MVSCQSKDYWSKARLLPKSWLLSKSMASCRSQGCCLSVASHPKALLEDVSEPIQEETQSFQGVQTRSRKPKSFIASSSHSVEAPARLPPFAPCNTQHHTFPYKVPNGPMESSP